MPDDPPVNPATDLTGSARGTSATSYAIPVNDALAVASQLKRS